MLKKTIKIIAPARLHFGFLELKNNQNNSFGGIGLTIDKFYTKPEVVKYCIKFWGIKSGYIVGKPPPTLI